MRSRLRAYQLADLAAINVAFRDHKAVCYQAPTGSGKTVLAAEFIRSQNDDRIVVLVHATKS